MLATHIWSTVTASQEKPVPSAEHSCTQLDIIRPSRNARDLCASPVYNHHSTFRLGVQAATATAVSALAPPDATVAPPGYYMLFLVSALGTPSAAAFVRLSGSYPPTDTLPSGGQLTTGAALQSLNNQYYLTVQARQPHSLQASTSFSGFVVRVCVRVSARVDLRLHGGALNFRAVGASFFECFAALGFLSGPGSFRCPEGQGRRAGGRQPGRVQRLPAAPVRRVGALGHIPVRHFYGAPNGPFQLAMQAVSGQPGSSRACSQP